MEEEKAIAKFVDEKKDKLVLVLGQFSDDSNISDIVDAVRRAGYEPVRLDDIRDHPDHDLRQKVAFVATAVRFVVIDDSAPSGHIAEIEILSYLDITRIYLRLDGRAASAMTAISGTDSTNAVTAPYTLADLPQTVQNCVTQIEAIIEARRGLLEKACPWRQ